MIMRSIDEVLSRPTELYATCVSPPLRWLSGIHRTCNPPPLSLSSSALAPRDIIPKLLKPLKIAGGTITLSNRIIIAPTSKSHKLSLPVSIPESPERVRIPNTHVAPHYAQLATPGSLLITESICIALIPTQGLRISGTRRKKKDDNRSLQQSMPREGVSMRNLRAMRDRTHRTMSRRYCRAM